MPALSMVDAEDEVIEDDDDDFAIVAPAVRPVSVEPWTGQERARMRRVCDYLIDAEDELLYLLPRDPGLQPDVDTIVTLLVKLTKMANH